MFKDKNSRNFILSLTVLSLIGFLTVIVIIPAVAALITAWIDTIVHVFQDWFRRISTPGESRIEGLVQICLYIIFVVVFLRCLKRI